MPQQNSLKGAVCSIKRCTRAYRASFLLLNRAQYSQTICCRKNLTEEEDFHSVGIKPMHSKSCCSVNCLEAFFIL